MVPIRVSPLEAIKFLERRFVRGSGFLVTLDRRIDRVTAPAALIIILERESSRLCGKSRELRWLPPLRSLAY
jgi:hypothetical protein